VLDGAIEDGSFRHAAGEMPVAGTNHTGPVKLGFRPESAEMTAPGEAGSLAGEVYVVEPLGNETLVAVTVGDEQVNLRAPAGFNPPVGERCGVRPDAGRLHLFDPETEAAISTAAGASPQPDTPTRREESDD
jgi:ABC-type sugar transport system ATPase subunit